MPHKPFGPYEKFVKRPLDCLLSFCALVVFSPLLLIISLLIKKEMGSPVLFRQLRIGKDDKEFYMFKFRSMTEERDENGIYLPDEERMTKVGNFIRKTSIDELPSLINILKGDMAVIGPRPLPVRYLKRYSEYQRRRHDVRPGLSSPSTVKGRNTQSWEDQLEGDVWYVDHVSFLTDAKSVLDTIRIVLNHKGATAEDGGARGEFLGIMSIAELKTDAEGSYMKI
ncbi:MAG: sugar transferase [Blautia sp.]|nr:sugar transferase [Blautia sp.]